MMLSRVWNKFPKRTTLLLKSIWLPYQMGISCPSLGYQVTFMRNNLLQKSQQSFLCMVLQEIWCRGSLIALKKHLLFSLQKLDTMSGWETIEDACIVSTTRRLIQMIRLTCLNIGTSPSKKWEFMMFLPLLTISWLWLDKKSCLILGIVREQLKCSLEHQCCLNTSKKESIFLLPWLLLFALLMLIVKFFSFWLRK